MGFDYDGTFFFELRFEITEILLFLYQAHESFVQFKVHLERVALDAHIRWHRSEVRLKRAVVPTRNSNVAAAEDARVALLGPRQRLDERVVRVTAEEIVNLAVRVAAQHALIVLTSPHCAVVAKNSLNITSIICVLIHFNSSFRNTLGLTQGALPHN